MSKKLFAPIVFLLSSMLIGCQPDPTPIHSTRHQAEKPKAADAHSTGNHHGGTKTEQHNTTHGESAANHAGANHDSMAHSAMKSAPDAAAQPFDLQFLDTMIAHHEGAIEMAKAAGAKTQNAELKSFAAKIVADQTREIGEMKRWRDGWFAGKPSALNMEMAGMTDSMKGMDAAKMNQASGGAFDTEFVNQMTPHHEGAVLMAREALNKAEHAEIKTLANQIIAAQEAEIKMMRDWKAKWAK